MRKNVSKAVLAFLLVLPLFWSCQVPMTDLPALPTDAAAARHLASPATVVPCPEDVVDSSAAIQSALENAAPGETVQLEPGTYYIQAGVHVTTAFTGRLRGAGMDKTVITTLPGTVVAKVPISGFAAFNGGEAPLLTALFYFEVPQGQKADIAMSDMSIVVTDPVPAPWTRHSASSRTPCST